MAVNVPLVHISDLNAQTTASDTDCMVIGNTDAKKITIPNLAKAILAKAAGAVSSIMSSNLTANRALISNGSGKVAISSVTSTELEYLDGVKSSVQDQLDELNANSIISQTPGSMRKWADGTLEQWKYASFDATASTSATLTVNFPAAFIDTNYMCFVNPARNGSILTKPIWEGNVGGNVQRTVSSSVFSCSKTTSNYGIGFYVYAIGKWK